MMVSLVVGWLYGVKSSLRGHDQEHEDLLAMSLLARRVEAPAYAPQCQATWMPHMAFLKSKKIMAMSSQF